MSTGNGVERDLIIRTPQDSGLPGRKVETILTTLEIARVLVRFDLPAGIDAKRGPRAEGWRFALDQAEGRY